MFDPWLMEFALVVVAAKERTFALAVVVQMYAFAVGKYAPASVVEEKMLVVAAEEQNSEQLLETGIA